jgi:hypothetical protein
MIFRRNTHQHTINDFLWRKTTLVSNDRYRICYQDRNQYNDDVEEGKMKDKIGNFTFCIAYTSILTYTINSIYKMHITA